MKIFMTGASGFVGKSIVAGFIEKGHHVSVLLLPDDKFEFIDSVEIIRGDITQPKTIKGKMKDHDAIIHLAGVVGYGQAFSLCNEVNVQGTLNLANEAISTGIKRFVHMSSVSVYGRISDGQITEDRNFLKIGDPYGDTKIDAEILLNRMQEKGLLDITCIRPTVIYGPGDKQFLPKLLENLTSGNAKIIGDGKNRVDLIHVDDVVDFFTLVLENEKSFGEAYNLTNTENGNWNQLMEIISAKVHYHKRIGHVPYIVAYIAAATMEFVAKFTKKPPLLTRYAVRVIGKNYNYSTEKSQRELNFTPKVDLTRGITTALNCLEVSKC